MVLTGQSLAALPARDWGMLLGVVEPERLDRRVDEAVCQVFNAQPDAMRAAKRLQKGCWLMLMSRKIGRHS